MYLTDKRWNNVPITVNGHTRYKILYWFMPGKENGGHALAQKDFTNEQKQLIRDVLKDMEEQTCLTYVEGELEK